MVDSGKLFAEKPALIRALFDIPNQRRGRRAVLAGSLAERAEMPAVRFLLCSLQEVQAVVCSGTEMEEIMNRIKGTVLIIAGIVIGLLLSSPAAQAAARLAASPSSQQFYLNGQNIHLGAYEINGSNYVKLRDVGQAVDFGVTYDATTNSVHINPEQPYTEEVKAFAESGAGDGYLTNGKPVTEKNVLEILRQIKKDWPQDTVWGNRDTPGTHKNEVSSTAASKVMRTMGVSATYGCSGYAAMVSSLIFGDETNPARRLDNLEQVRPGDILFRVNNKTGNIWHVEVALESPDELSGFHITDGDYGSVVCWPSSPYCKENLDCFRGENKTHRLEAWTRYPEDVFYTGSSVDAWPTGVNN